MRNDRKIKILSIVALVLAITGMSLGFAAFSSTLSISSSATVTPNSDDFKILWYSDETDTTALSIPAVGTNGSSGSAATIVNSKNPSITGITANFTKPGQVVAYNFFAKNVGKYTVYGDEIVQGNAVDSNKQITCTIPDGSGATPALVDAACNDISIRIGAGSEGEISAELVIGEPLTNFYLYPNSVASVVLLIEYAADGDMADGPFEVHFGDISITYTSAPNE